MTLSTKFSKYFASVFPKAFAGWEEVDLKETPRRPKHTNFRKVGSGAYSGSWWFLSVEPVPKIDGEIRLSVTLSACRDRSVLDAPASLDVSNKIEPGSLPVHIYMGKRAYSWVLFDYYAKYGYRPPTECWQASDYSAPLEQVFSEAFISASKVIREAVLPKMGG